ncbi:MAG: hypothetical protein NWE94_01455 [Candidatus Bathyarchaeota archaeon]|nr:hypothetical protein [Candidatus Bathyarchaeota archaeon]
MLFLKLAELTENAPIKQQLLEISNESKKHAAIFKGVSEKMGFAKANAKECEKKLGVVSSTIKQISAELAKKEKLTSEELYEFISKLDSAEIEEQFMQIQAKTFQLMASEISRLYAVNFEEFEELFMNIARDEENHRIQLKNIRETLSVEQKENGDAVKVKFQNPDAWIRTNF